MIKPLDIYVKPMKKAIVAGRTDILVQDVAEVLADRNTMDAINALKLFSADPDARRCYLVSVTDIIKCIKKKYPNDTVNNVGEMDTLVEYAPTKSKDNPWFKWLKVAFVCLVLFAGSATAIMSFYSDAQLYEVFKNSHKMIFGWENERPYILQIPYAIGLAFGIIMFFNHFMGRKITNDPTPIEVQISIYETEVTDTLIDILDAKKTKENNNP